MAVRSALLVVLLIGVSAVLGRIRTNQWLVRLQTDGTEDRHVLKARAKRIASETGFKTWLDHHDDYFRQNEFLFLHQNKEGASKGKSLHDALVGHPSIESAEQLRGYRRTKRGFREIEQPTEREQQPKTGRTLSEKESEIVRALSSDPLFRKEWYIHNTGQAEGTPGLDLNVLSPWLKISPDVELLQPLWTMESITFTPTLRPTMQPKRATISLETTLSHIPDTLTIGSTAMERGVLVRSPLLLETVFVGWA